MSGIEKQQIAFAEAPMRDLAAKIVYHLPDFIVQEFDEPIFPRLKKIFAVCGFLDISGFTSIAELTTSGGDEAGFEHLTDSLNEYMRKIVDIVLHYGGDVMNFAGDAILMLWPLSTQSAEKVAQILHLAMTCAQDIQENCQNFSVPIPGAQFFNVKCGISAGLLFVGFVGDQMNHYYVCYGDAIQDVSLAESLAVAGEIILSPSAWNLVKEKSWYEVKPRDPNHTQFLKVVGGNSLSAWKEGFTQKRPALEYVRKLEIRQIEVYHNLKDYLTDYLIRKLEDSNLQMKHYGEVRRLTVMFVSFHVRHKVFPQDQLKILHESFEFMRKCISTNGGCLLRTFSFDKGNMFLAVFGLPGCGTGYTAKRALDCARGTLTTLSGSPGVRQVSIGITTGKVYCGMIGHELRHEYTVIGGKVNLAARIMENYRGGVTCDCTTVKASHLPLRFFKREQAKTFKGIRYTKSAYYTYQGPLVEALDELPKFQFPAIERSEEFNEFRKHFQQSQIFFLVYDGPAGIGKSHLLDAIIFNCEEETKTRVCLIPIKMSTESATHALRRILLEVLEMHNFRCPTSRQHEICRLVRIFYKNNKSFKFCNNCSDVTSYLWLINGHFGVNFPSSASNEDPEEEISILFQICYILLFAKASSFEGKLLVVIHAIHRLDRLDISFLRYLINYPIPNIFFVMTRESRSECLQTKPELHFNAQMRTSPNVRIFRVKNLATLYIATLLCQMLRAVAVPKKLVEVITNTVGPTPGAVRQYLWDLLKEGRILPREESSCTVEEAEQNHLIYLKQLFYLTPKMHLMGFSTKEEKLQQLQSGSLQGKQVFLLPDITDGLIVPEWNKRKFGTFSIDSFTKEVISCAAILGTMFNVGLLKKIIPGLEFQAPGRFNDVLYELVLTEVFECPLQDQLPQVKKKAYRRQRDSGIQCGAPSAKLNQGTAFDFQRIDPLNCTCRNESIATSNNGIREVPCKVLSFRDPEMQKSLYESKSKSERQELHRKAAEELESMGIFCSNCNGETYVKLDSNAIRNTSCLSQGPAPSLKLMGLMIAFYDLPITVCPPTMKWREELTLRARFRASEERPTKYLEDLICRPDSNDFKSLSFSISSGMNWFRRSILSTTCQELNVDWELDLIEETTERSSQKNTTCNSSKDNLAVFHNQATANWKRSRQQKENSAEKIRLGYSPSVARVFIQWLLSRNEDHYTVIRSELVMQQCLSTAISHLQNIGGIIATNCECITSMAAIFEDIASHCSKAGLHIKATFCLLNAARIWMVCGDLDRAHRRVSAALGLLRELTHEGLEEETPWKMHINIIAARAHSSYGQIAMLMGKNGTASRHLLKALEVLTESIPTERHKLEQEAAAEEKVWELRAWQQAPKNNKPDSYTIKEWVTLLEEHEKARIFSHLFLFHYTTGEPRDHILLRYLLLKGLNLAEETNFSVSTLLALYFQGVSLYSALGQSNIVLQLLHGIVETIEDIPDIDCFSSGVVAIAIAQLVRNSARQGFSWLAIETGFTAWNVCENISRVDAVVSILDSLKHSLLMAFDLPRLKRVLDCLFEMMDNHPGELLSEYSIYTFVLAVLYDVGVPFRSFDVCNRALRGYASNADPSRNQRYLRMRILGMYALWEARHGHVTRAKKLCALALNDQSLTSECQESEADCVDTYLRLWEADLISYVDLEKFEPEMKSAKKHLQRLQAYEILLRSVLESYQAAKPRYHFLKGYLAMILGNWSRAKESLRACKDWSTLQGNRHQFLWLEYHKIMWKRSKPPPTLETWFAFSQDTFESYQEKNRNHWEYRLYNFPVPKTLSLKYTNFICDLF